MSGFAILFQPDSTVPGREDAFQSLLKQTAHFKQLEEFATVVEGRYCTAAKLDALSSLHRGITRDEQSGSWLVAAGTVVALGGNNDPHLLLGKLLSDYLENGSHALEHYDGHFALAIYNGREDSLSIVSDPMGLFAIYYTRHGQQVFISSSAMAVARQVCARPDDLMIDCFLRTGRPYGEMTFWRDVNRVRPATVIKIMPEKFQEFEYWIPEIDHRIARLPMIDALDIADEKIGRIFKRFLSRDGNIWADLTGGFDTRMTTMFLSKLDFPFIAYCVGPEGHPDVDVSRLVSKEMGWEYRHMPLPDDWAEEQLCFFDAALGKGDGLLNVFQLAGVLKGGQEKSLTSVVNISGGGADEWRYHIFGANILIAAAISKVNFDNFLDTKIVDDIPILVMRYDRKIEVRNAIMGHFSRSLSNFIESSKVTQMDIAFLRYRHPIHAGAYLSAQAGIMRSLTPFCSKELENFGLSINHQWRIKYDFRFARYLLERENPRLAAIRTEKGEPALPIRFTNLYKFGPLWKFMINKLSEYTFRKIFKKQLIIFPKWSQYQTYPLPSWRTARIKWAISEKLLDPVHMCSGALYNPAGLNNLTNQVLAGVFEQSEFLERVVTVEMALRAVGTGLE